MSSWLCLLCELLLTLGAASDPHTSGLTMTKLQNPTKLAFEQVNNDLKEVSAAHKKLGRAIDKVGPLGMKRKGAVTDPVSHVEFSPEAPS